MNSLKKINKLNRNIFKLSKVFRRGYNEIPFLDLHENVTGEKVANLPRLLRKHLNIETLSYKQLQNTLEILKKFNITALEACREPHVFCINHITLDNYGEILKECGFIKILPFHVIRYHTLVRSRTIAQLKKESLIPIDMNLESSLLDQFEEMPDKHKKLLKLPDESTSIVMVRMSVLERYLIWRLRITSEEFKKYCQNYLPLKHKPMSDIKEAIRLAQEEIKLDSNVIRRNGFIISSDPINTELIIKNVPSIAGMDIREAIRIDPAILKNNYNSLLQIKSLLEEYNIPEEAQRKCLRVYCMCPKTVKERLDELKSVKEYQVLSTNPRVLSLVVHKRKMMARLNKIEAAKKHCFSLNHLVSSSKVFNNYLNNFGDKVCGRDIGILISSSLHINKPHRNQTELCRMLLKKLKKHKYWLHAPLHVIAENLQYLKSKFDDQIIFENCHLLLYPISEVEAYTDHWINLRKQTMLNKNQLDTPTNVLQANEITDSQILSLVLYEIEKKYHFSGDGIWAKQEGIRIEPQSMA